MTLRDAIARLVEGRDLETDEMAAVVETILGGEATPAQIAAFLTALRMKGETVAELVGAARAMRAHAVVVPDVPAGTVDTCGTGGDGASTLNVSTAAGLVVAAAGVPVAKHGNRAVSGVVGGADVLEALGVTLVLPPAALGACLNTVGFAFLFAPALQPALRHAAAPRRELGIRTFFNLLGPLTNPARVRRQVIGVFDRRWLRPLAETLAALGTERAWVVSGPGGLDEIGLDGETAVAEIVGGRVTARTVSAADAGLAGGRTAAVRVRSLTDAAAQLRAVLAGERGPARDIVCLNAAAALLVAGAVDDLRAGAARAAAAIDGGAAARLLAALVEFTSTHAGPPAAGRAS
ncbi:MAG TPA: anthranilate phosphoribosyltransferase [Candidatus Binatia bacterium]|nr:anthranilate phosphoribosyltransferase [Candidatus Binatia bacterium]